MFVRIVTTNHCGQGKCPCKISGQAVAVGCPLGRSTSKQYDRQFIGTANAQVCKPYRMQSITQKPLCTLVANEGLQDLEFIYATRLDTAKVMKNETLMIGEHKFVVDAVLASLAPCSEATEEK